MPRRDAFAVHQGRPQSVTVPPVPNGLADDCDVRCVCHDCVRFAECGLQPHVDPNARVVLLNSPESVIDVVCGAGCSIAGKFPLSRALGGCNLVATLR